MIISALATVQVVMSTDHIKSILWKELKNATDLSLSKNGQRRIQLIMAIGEHGHSIMQKCHLKRAKLKRPNKTAMLPSLQLVVPQVKTEMHILKKEVTY